MIDQRYPEDEQLETWIGEAGDPSVEPEASHLEGVRRMILDRTQVSAPQTRWPRRLVLVALAGTAAALLIGLFPWGDAASPSWAQVIEATRLKPWIHGLSTDPNGTKREVWFSPSLNIAARRWGKQAVFSDLQRKIRFSYDPDTGCIVRTSEAAAHDLRSLESVFLGIARGDEKLGSPMPRGETVAQNRSDVEHDGRKFIEYELTVENKLSGRPPRTLTTNFTFRVDPETRLVRSMTMTQDEDGKPTFVGYEEVVEFDYPDEGPTDIFALGVPRDAKIDDPAGNLARVVAANVAGRRSLTSCCAVVERSWGEPDKFLNQAPHRLWRKGPQWRLEMGMPTPEAVEAVAAIRDTETHPDDFGTAPWWNGLLSRFDIWPKEVCDGEAIYRTRSSDTEKLGWEWVEHSSPDVTLVRGSAAEFAIERHAYPLLMIPSERFRGTLDEHPKHGPPGSVTLVVVPAHIDAGSHIVTYLFQLDSERGYVALQRDVFEQTLGDDGFVKEMSVRERYVNEQFQQSPDGTWYPTVVRRKNALDLDNDGKKESDEVYRFWVEFDAEIPDSLFEPGD
jgi:hypothetical protein